MPTQKVVRIRTGIVERRWKKYREQTLPKNAPKDMIEAFRQAFYCGVITVFNEIILAAGMSEGELERTMASMNREATAFAARNEE